MVGRETEVAVAEVVVANIVTIAGKSNKARMVTVVVANIVTIPRKSNIAGIINKNGLYVEN